MKRTTKLGVLSFLLALMGALFLCACTLPVPKEEKEYFTVTLEYDEEMGNVSLSAPQEGKTYAKGEHVTVSPVPKNGFLLKDVRVNSTPLLAENGIYAFNVQSDSVVSVSFEEESVATPVFTAKELASVQGKVTFDGQYTRTYTGSIETEERFDILASFGDGTVYIYEGDGDTVVHDYVSVDRIGELAIVYHDENDAVIYDDLGGELLFEDAYNPFDRLKPEDFELTADGWRISDEEQAKAVLLAIAGYQEDNVAVTLTVEEGAVTSLVITSSYMGSDYGYEAVYVYTLADVGKGRVPDHYNTPYGEENPELDAALQQAAQAKSYTISRTELDLSDGDEYSYPVYVTEEAVHVGAPGAQQGYVLKNGTVFPYSYDENAERVMLAGPTEFHSLDTLRASFGGFSSSLFQREGSMYTLHTDAIANGSSISGMPGKCASAFAVGGDYTLEASATDLTIVLQNGALHEISFLFNYVGSTGFVTYTFSDFGTTQVPVDLSSASTIYEAFQGVYEGKELKENADGLYYVDYLLEVTESQFFLTIDGGERTAASYVEITSAQGYFLIALQVGEKIWYITTDEGPNKDGFLLLSETQEDMVLLLPEGSGGPEVSTPYPHAYYGTYEGEDENGKPYQIIINEEGVNITDGEEVTLLSEDIYFTYLDGICLLYGEVPFFITAEQYGALREYVQKIAFYDNNEDVYVILDRVGEGVEPPPPVEIPGAYVSVGTYYGNWAATDYFVTFTKTGITVKIGSADAVEAENIVYDAMNRNFYFDLNGTAYAILNMDDTAYGVGTLWLMCDDTDLQVVLTPYTGETPPPTDPDEPVEPDPDEPSEPEVPEEGDLTIPAGLVGTFEGSWNGKQYVFTFTATSLTVTIDGTKAEVSDFTCELSPNGMFYTIEVKLNGTKVEISTSGGVEQVSSLGVMDGWDMVSFSRKA